MTLPNLSPALGEDNKRGWTNLAKNLRHLESRALNEGSELVDSLAELASRCEALASESYPCDLPILRERLKRYELNRQLAELDA